MEGYKSFKEAAMSVKGLAQSWKYTATDEIFTFEEMLEVAEKYDEFYAPDGWNYFVSFPDGELGILSTDDNEVVPTFLPMKKGSFCMFCGAQLRENSMFCPSCGKPIKK